MSYIYYVIKRDNIMINVPHNRINNKYQFESWYNMMYPHIGIGIFEKLPMAFRHGVYLQCSNRLNMQIF